MGSLPVRFLGVPLISSKLSMNDCIPLIHKITSKVTSWTTKFLAYSRKLQLIKSILFAMQSFWSAYFILPKFVIRAIQSILCRFLWKGPLLGKCRDRIYWKMIILPLRKGGLAIKSIEDWNKGQILLHLVHVIQPITSSL